MGKQILLFATFLSIVLGTGFGIVSLVRVSATWNIVLTIIGGLGIGIISWQVITSIVSVIRLSGFTENGYPLARIENAVGWIFAGVVLYFVWTSKSTASPANLIAAKVVGTIITAAFFNEFSPKQS